MTLLRRTQDRRNSMNNSLSTVNSWIRKFQDFSNYLKPIWLILNEMRESMKEVLLISSE